METAISDELLQLVIIPFLIFFARILDVSINTIRIILMLNGNKFIAPVLGFFESMIWLLAISQIFQNLNSPVTYVAYAGGFGSGVLVGMLIEERLALGRVLIRVITSKPDTELTDFLRKNGYRYTNVDAESQEGKVNLLFTVVKRDKLEEIIAIVQKFNPNAFYTVEAIKRVSDEDLHPQSNYRTNIFRRLTGWKRG